MSIRKVRGSILRLAGLFGKHRLERDLADEVRCNLELHIEDNLRRALDLASENTTPVAMTALTRQMYEMARAAGYSRNDYTSLLKVLEEMAGVEVRSAI